MLIAAYCGRKRILDRVIQDATGGPYSHTDIQNREIPGQPGDEIPIPAVTV